MTTEFTATELMATKLIAPLPWQTQQWRRLSSNLEQRSLAHALLLSGPVGLGKTAFATAFCHRLLCREPTSQSACGQCKACLLLAAGNHPDFHLVTLEEKSQSLKIDQIRDLVIALAKTPQISSRHCVLVEPADCLNINAANALLKLLEEPPGDAVLLLVSAHVHRLSATIRSRCQQVQFAIPDPELALAWLKQNEVPDHAAREVLALAGGAPLKAFQLQQQQGIEDYEAIAKQLAAVLARRVSVVDAAADFASRSGTGVADTMLDWLRIIAIKTFGSGDSVRLPKTLAGFLDSGGDPLALFRFYDKLNAAKSHLLSTANPNKNLLWEECLLDWQALIKSSPHSTSGATNAPN
jgi:DNA polymerase-3 subunit delta'